MRMKYLFNLLLFLNVACASITPFGGDNPTNEELRNQPDISQYRAPVLKFEVKECLKYVKAWAPYIDKRIFTELRKNQDMLQQIHEQLQYGCEYDYYSFLDLRVNHFAKIYKTKKLKDMFAPNCNFCAGLHMRNKFPPLLDRWIDQTLERLNATTTLSN